MKYLHLTTGFSKIPMSLGNLGRAIQRIGEIDPYRIKRTTLKRKCTNINQLSDKEFFYRGVLNIRKRLNRHLGKNGKCTNKMIILISRVYEMFDDEQLYLIAHVPYATYVKIINATYEILKEIDPMFCNCLLETELTDNYMPKADIKKVSLESMAPVQTHIILMSECETLNKSQLKQLKNEIRR